MSNSDRSRSPVPDLGSEGTNQDRNDEQPWTTIPATGLFAQQLKQAVSTGMRVARGAPRASDTGLDLVQLLAEAVAHGHVASVAVVQVCLLLLQLLDNALLLG